MRAGESPCAYCKSHPWSKRSAPNDGGRSELFTSARDMIGNPGCLRSDPPDIERKRRIMRNVVAKLVIGMAITAIGMFGADNSIGTWKRQAVKTKSGAPDNDPISSLTTVRAESNGGLKVTITGERIDGATINTSYYAKFDGKEYPVVGANWDTIAIKQVDPNTFTFETKTAGRSHTSGRIVVSKDGKTMTETRTGTNAEGKPSTITIVYDKQ